MFSGHTVFLFNWLLTQPHSGASVRWERTLFPLRKAVRESFYRKEDGICLVTVRGIR